MFSQASRASKPKLSLSISTAFSTQQAVAPASQRVSLSLKSPTTTFSPVSPSPLTPTSRNTRANQRGFSTYQAPTFAYAVNPETRGILKRNNSTSSNSSTSSRSSSISETCSQRKVGFRDEPIVYCVTPVCYEESERYTPMTKQNRWSRATYGEE